MPYVLSPLARPWTGYTGGSSWLGQYEQQVCLTPAGPCATTKAPTLKDVVVGSLATAAGLYLLKAAFARLTRPRRNRRRGSRR